MPSPRQKTPRAPAAAIAGGLLGAALATALHAAIPVLVISGLAALSGIIAVTRWAPDCPGQWLFARLLVAFALGLFGWYSRPAAGDELSRLFVAVSAGFAFAAVRTYLGLHRHDGSNPALRATRDREV